MSVDSEYWMDYVIRLAAGGQSPSLRVGVALVTGDGELICSAFEGEVPGKSWRQVARLKMHDHPTGSAHSLFLTVNTLAPEGNFDLADLLQETECERVYVGLPDPRLHHYRNDDPVATREQVSRFPDSLQREILNQNRELYEASEHNIQLNTHYQSHRIGESMHSSLNSNGLAVSRKEFDANRTAPALASLIEAKHGIGYGEAVRVVKSSLSNAFDVKYGSYEDSYDARSAHPSWVDDFEAVRDASFFGEWRSARLLNVGVGSGSEAVTLFSDCSDITFVDIAERGLRNIGKRFEWAKTVRASADDLSELPSGSFDLYVSLRTYNSSFFESSAAAREAHRVLRPGGLIIVSVANGFLHSGRDRFVVPGLILPGTEFVDLYRGMDTARSLRIDLGAAGFEAITIAPASTEILLSGVAA